MSEEWKTIEEFPDYQVSTLGRVKSLKFGKEKIKSLLKSKDGYDRIRLHKDGKGITKLVSRLVAKTFLKKEEGKETVDHKNIIKSDNCLENLRWADRTQQSVNRNLPLGKSGHRNILIFRSVYRVSICRYGKKHTKVCGSLEEAIEYRDKFLTSYNNNLQNN